MSITEELVNSLLEELNCETVFTIPLFGGIEISEAVVVTWIIMAVLVLLSVCLVRNLKVENPGKKQLLLETGVSFLYDFFEETMGEKGRRYIYNLLFNGKDITLENVSTSEWLPVEGNMKNTIL